MSDVRILLSGFGSIKVILDCGGKFAAKRSYRDYLFSFSDQNFCKYMQFFLGRTKGACLVVIHLKYVCIYTAFNVNCAHSWIK